MTTTNHQKATVSNGEANGCRAQDGAQDFASGGSVITKEEVEARGTGTREARDSYRPGLRGEARVWWTGVMFLTRLPVPCWVDHHPAFLVRSMMWFPLIGAIIGGWGAAWHAAAAALWPSPGHLAGALSTLATVWLTGCFHEDGLADTIDGFGGGWGRAQILRIMKDSRVGTYALVGSALLLQAKAAALAALGGAAPAAMVAAHAAARWAALPLVYCCPYLQDEEDAKRGLYNWFAASRRLLTLPRLALGTAVAAAAPFALLPAGQGAAVCATVVVVSAAAGYYARLVLEGVVGDYLGATIAVAELAVYLVLAADWSSAVVRWRPLAVLAAVAALPVLYTRRVVHTL